MLGKFILFIFGAFILLETFVDILEISTFVQHALLTVFVIISVLAIILSVAYLGKIEGDHYEETYDGYKW
jgi:membrane protein implicated in regulation of membrane protease activity